MNQSTERPMKPTNLPPNSPNQPNQPNPPNPANPAICGDAPDVMPATGTHVVPDVPDTPHGPDWLDAALGAGRPDTLQDDGFSAAVMHRVLALEEANQALLLRPRDALARATMLVQQDRRQRRWVGGGAGLGLLVVLAALAAFGAPSLPSELPAIALQTLGLAVGTWALALTLLRDAR